MVLNPQLACGPLSGVGRAVEAPVNRRRHERVPLERPSRLFEMDDQGVIGAGVDCTAVDLSRSGLGVSCRRLTHVGKVVAVVLSVPGGPPRVFFGVVRHARYTGPNAYAIGIEFIEPPKKAGVDGWIARMKVDGAG